MVMRKYLQIALPLVLLLAMFAVPWIVTVPRLVGRLPPEKPALDHQQPVFETDTVRVYRFVDDGETHWVAVGKGGATRRWRSSDSGGPMTIYGIAPVKGKSFKVGDELLVMDMFPENVRLVQFRRANMLSEHGDRYSIVGYAENDCAQGIRQDRVRRLMVRKVSKVSGLAQAVAVEYWPEGAA